MPLLHTAHLRVRPDAVQAFRERLLRHARTSVAAEPGCHSFDVHQERGDPALFMLHEVYADDAALAAHREAPHYLAFREDVKDWVVERTWYVWEPVRDAERLAGGASDAQPRPPLVTRGGAG